MEGSTESGDRYDEFRKDRQKHVDAILLSTSRRKIVVAGPGTGKTHLFRQLVENRSQTLTLTFINTLVEDLSLELCGLSDVRTLHSFARSELARCTHEEVKVYLRLSGVIRRDAKVLLNQDVDFDAIFHNRDDKNQSIAFYKQRKDYYGHYGMADVVFSIVTYWEKKKEKIPAYDQVVVDEFQDFNRLEVSLIDLLAEKSPVLVAGDDDQALYDFKHATPDHIRHKHGDGDPTYEPFCLPYCSRSTQVIVEAAQDIVASALRNGLLKERIDKSYTYFADAKKDHESALHPTISHLKAHPKQIPWTLQKHIGEIALLERKAFTVLVITPYHKQAGAIAASLRTKGFANVSYEEKRDEREPALIDGLKLLLEDDKSNLGWRIVAECLLQEGDFAALLQKTEKHDVSVFSLIDDSCKKEVKTLLRVLRAVRDDKAVSEEQVADVLRQLGRDLLPILTQSLGDQAGFNNTGGASAQTRKVHITVTTVQSSKGLAADYVFIAHFDDKYLVSDNQVCDKDVCSIIVAITRARRKLFIVSSAGANDSMFLTWIKPERIASA